MPGQFRPRGVTMRDCLKNRAGFDRVLMAVAATFLTVSATSAFAQAIRPATAPPNSRSMRRSRVPNPPTFRLRPSTISRLDTTAPVPDAGEGAPNTQRRTTKPSDVATAPADRYEQGRYRQERCRDHRRRRRRRRPPQRRPPSPPRNRSRPPATCRRRTSRSPTSCATCWAQNRCAISTARPSAPRWRNSTPRATTRRCGRRPAR